MELKIDVDEPPRGALYHMTDSELVTAFRDAEELLASYGSDRDETARLLGLSPITLKAYSRGVSTVSHRRIPAVTLDRIRDLAIDTYWRAAAAPYRAEVAGEGPLYFVPIWHALGSDGLLRERHPHPLRALEVADKNGGWVRVGWSVDRLTQTLPPLDPQATLRSRWRHSARRIYLAFGDDIEAAASLLCGIADCCRCSLWQFSTEYRPWRLQVTPSQVSALEMACRDLAAGDEIRPYESDVRRAMAELEDF